MKRVKTSNNARTKIICTIGPASRNTTTLKKLIRSGMVAARLNFSHGSHSDHTTIFQNIRKISEELDIHLPIIQDLQGPKIRIGDLAESEVYLRRGNKIRITTRQIKGTAEIISTNYRRLPIDMRSGNTILLDDGLIKLRALKVKKDEVVCKIIEGGKLRPFKGMNLPGVKITTPSLTRKDREDLKLGLSLGVDYIALSFVRSTDDIKKLRTAIKSAGNPIPIIAKIEREEALESIEEIIKESDAIMVARGDLGVEMPSEDVPLIQKMIIEKCNFQGKPVITATQMLESMVKNPTPTRAETSDVANAVLDGTDAVMLSAETSIGKFPVQAVKKMNNILIKTESALPHQLQSIKKQIHEAPAEAVGRAACVLAEQLDAQAIVPITHGGTTARIISKYRPKATILAATANRETARRLNLVWGVYPVLLSKLMDTDTTLEMVEHEIAQLRIIKRGKYVVYTAGMPMKVMGKTNMLKVSKI